MNIHGERDSELVEPTPPIRHNRWVELTEVGPRNYEFLYKLGISEGSGHRWRFLGTVPNPIQFGETAWAGVLSQFIVRERSQHVEVGAVAAYNADLHHGHCAAAIAVIASAENTGIGYIAGELFLDYLFRTYDLRKIYFELPEFNVPSIRSLIGNLFQEEGRLREHIYYDRRHWDRCIYAIYRSDFDAHLRRRQSLQ
jgi:hypothetical protein